MSKTCCVRGCKRETKHHRRACPAHVYRKMKYGVYGPPLPIQTMRSNGEGTFSLSHGWFVSDHKHPLASSEGRVYLSRKLLYAQDRKPSCVGCGKRLYWKHKINTKTCVYVMYKDGDKRNCQVDNLAPMCYRCRNIFALSQHGSTPLILQALVSNTFISDAVLDRADQCKLASCTAPVKPRHGYCQRHGDRFAKFGDPYENVPFDKNGQLLKNYLLQQKDAA